MTTDPTARAVGADLVVLPGSRSTVSDLDWLRTRRSGRRGHAGGAARGDRCWASAAAIRCWRRPSTTPSNPESDTVAGLGLLPARVAFGTDKVLRRPAGGWRGHEVVGYEIHHGVATVDGHRVDEAFLEGGRVGRVWGTMWHGAFENDGFRRAWLESATTVSGQPFRAHPGALGFRGRREAMLDRLADAVAEHLDTGVLLRLTGAPVPG